MTDKITFPPYLFIIGPAGSGKTHIGQLLGKVRNTPYIDLDPLLTPSMRQKFEAGTPGGFSAEERDHYVNYNIIPTIDDTMQRYSAAIFGQAAYSQKFRSMLKDRFPEIVYLVIDAPWSVRLERMIRRGDSPGRQSFISSAETYWLAPEQNEAVFFNNHVERMESELVAEVLKIFSL